MPPPGQGHAIACTRCHLGDGQAKEGDAAHQGLVKNPSALACGSCHQGWPDKVKRSPMATNLGIIAQTRYLWGAQPSLGPEFAVRHARPLVAMPDPQVDGKPVDDFLRRRCLRCHLWGQGADSKGARRSAGCVACHRPYDAQGRPPQGHGLTRKVPVRQCRGGVRRAHPPRRHGIGPLFGHPAGQARLHPEPGVAAHAAGPALPGGPGLPGLPPP
jgi:hypothetical protein